MNAYTGPVATRHDDGQITLAWPHGKPREFTIATELFEIMVDQLNTAGALIAALTTGEPCDWDHESCCYHDDCTRPATHRRPVGMIGEDAIVELVCCVHAQETP